MVNGHFFQVSRNRNPILTIVRTQIEMWRFIVVSVARNRNEYLILKEGRSLYIRDVVTRKAIGDIVPAVSAILGHPCLSVGGSCIDHITIYLRLPNCTYVSSFK